MAIENITYESIRDTVKNWIKSNCSNITNYAGMSSAVKNGYSYTIGSSGSNAYTETAKATLSSSLSSATNASQVDTDMNTFWNLIGSPSGNITPDNFYKFINDMACFCATKLAFITSQTGNANSSSVRYLIYWTSNNNWNFDIYIDKSTATHHYIIANDVNTFWKNIIDMMTRVDGNIRVIPCKYTFTLS